MTQQYLRLLRASWFLPVCIVLAVILRAAVLSVPLRQTSDSEWYYQRAIGLANGNGYNEGGVLTAFWPVGWPGALAALFHLTGPSVLSGQIFNIVLAALVCLLISAVGSNLFGRATGNLAALLIAIFPNQIAYTPALLTEIFYEVLLLSSVYLLMFGRARDGLLAGIIFGVATLTKAQTLILPGFLLLWTFLARPTWAALRKAVVLGCAVYLMLALVVLPWSYRNWTVFHEIIPVSTNGGWTLLTGNNPEANGGYTPDTVLAEGINHNAADQVAMDKLAHDRAIGWIKTNPGRFLLLMPRKFFQLWAIDGEAEWVFQKGFAAYERHAALFRAVRILNQVYYFMLWAFAIPSIWLLLRRFPPDVSRWTHAGIAQCALITLISLVFSGQSRFHCGLMPFIAMYAAWTVTRLASGSSHGDGMLRATPVSMR
jgi:4-amino-4-deoxy-L-arabinose transferase-like glycosyltransferase